jgi:hypothetical protein
VTVANQGTGPMTVASVVPGGANASDFTVTSSTCATVQPKTSCTVLVTFTPGGAGPRTGTLTVTSDVATGSPPVTLTGTGLTAEIGLGAANLTFDPQKVGTPSNAQTVTVTNKGSAPMAMRDSTVAGATPKDFVLTDGCKGNTVAPGSNCSIAVVFQPNAKGASSGRLNLSNATGSAQSVALAGKGTQPEATVDPPSLGIAAKGQTGEVALSNTGDAPMFVGPAVVKGATDAFRITKNECGNELAPNASCKITVEWFTDAILTNQGSQDCWAAVLVIPTDDPVKRDLTIGLDASATVSKLLKGALNLNTCT